jgi:hypothetical protein
MMCLNCGNRQTESVVCYDCDGVFCEKCEDALFNDETMICTQCMEQEKSDQKEREQEA